jgi:hypothetical protein
VIFRPFLHNYGYSRDRCFLCDQLPVGYVCRVFLLAFILTPSPGSLFTHWIADSLTLWKSPVTDERLWTAALYYSILAKSTPVIFYFLAVVVAVGGVTILWSLGDGAAGNLMFDGGSICSSFPPFPAMPLTPPSLVWNNCSPLSLFRHS